MNTSAESRNIGALLRALRDNALIPKPHFQRRAVWTNKDKVALIETILQNYPFPEIYVVSGQVDVVSGDTSEWLVDGQQRVRTIYEYFLGEAPFKTNRLITTYRDLGEEQQKSFLSYNVAIRNLGILGDEKVREVFKRMNSTSYNLNNMERFNAAYLGEFKKFSEAAASLIDRWIGIFSPNDIRRMKDVSYAASLVSTMMSTYFHRDDDIEKYLETYNEQFSAKDVIAARLVSALRYFHELKLGGTPRINLKADFYTLLVEIDRQLGRQHRKPDPEAASRALKELLRSVSAGRETPPENPAAKRYYEATLQSVNDRASRIARGDAIRTIFEGVEASPFVMDLEVGKRLVAQMEAPTADDEIDEEGDADLGTTGSDHTPTMF
ncbi:DUF262 domain-containing protein [Phenylobacterium sp. LjRoot219]|uniref:DUF262 domain-containing protein n=1 Tax=Phenylobacterium sp. LjRoot219 TaxID=3342283 RepID=UPI003ECD7330